MPLLHYLSYGAILAAFAFVTLSLASGLLYVSELIEEHSRFAKVTGKRGIYGILVLHGVLYFSEALPPWHTLFSIFCHIIYLQNFSHTWPVISLSSPSFIASCVLVITDHFLWFFYFAHLTQEARHATQRGYGHYQETKHVPGFAEIATFFGICVWLAPLFLFLSLSANDNALPMSAAPPHENDTRYEASTSSRTSLIKFFFSSVLVYVPGLGKTSRRDCSEGIIAPHSPLPLQSQRDSNSMSSSSMAIPPAAMPDNGSHLLPDFRLTTPPKKDIPVRRDAAGVELRRTAQREKWT